MSAIAATDGHRAVEEFAACIRVALDRPAETLHINPGENQYRALDERIQGLVRALDPSAKGD